MHYRPRGPSISLFPPSIPHPVFHFQGGRAGPQTVRRRSFDSCLIGLPGSLKLQVWLIFIAVGCACAGRSSLTPKGCRAVAVAWGFSLVNTTARSRPVTPSYLRVSFLLSLVLAESAFAPGAEVRVAAGPADEPAVQHVVALRARVPAVPRVEPVHVRGARWGQRVESAHEPQGRGVPRARWAQQVAPAHELQERGALRAEFAHVTEAPWAERVGLGRAPQALAAPPDVPEEHFARLRLERVEGAGSGQTPVVELFVAEPDVVPG
jgi:hypothetical protein